jgi:hypothetical protein
MIACAEFCLRRILIWIVATSLVLTWRPTLSADGT